MTRPAWPPYRYQPGTGCQCPGCGGRAWNVGRTSAECANTRFCDVVLPLADGSAIGGGSLTAIEGAANLRLPGHRARLYGAH